MIVVRAAHHTSFTVSDLDRSLGFYNGVLGLEVLVVQTPDASYLADIVGYPELRLRIAFLKLPGSDHRLELIQYLNHAGPLGDLSTNRVGNSHVCLVVDDIFSAFEELRQQGVTFRSDAPVPITAGVNRGAFGAYFTDPDGIALELFQPASHG